MKYLFLFLTAFFILPSAYTQMSLMGEGISLGMVIDKSSGEAIPFATVSVLNAKDSSLMTGIVTDLDGRFTVSDLPAGEYLLKVQVLGYTSYFSSPFFIDKDHELIDFGQIELSPESTVLDQVVVQAMRERMQTVSGGYAINVDEKLAANNANAGALMRIVPGVFIDQSGTLELLGRSNVQLKVDGRLLNLNGKELVTYLQEIPSEEIVSIIVNTTPSSSESAQGSSGIIEIKTNRKKKKGLINRISGEIASRDKYNGSFTSLFNTEKLSVYARVNFRHDNYIEKIEEFYTWRENGAINQLMDYNERNVEIIDGFGARASIDYALNEHTTIGTVLRSSSLSMRNNPGAALTSIRDASNEITSENNINTNSNWGNQRHFANVNYRTSFGRENHNFKLEYSVNYRDWYNHLALEEETTAQGQTIEDLAYNRNGDFLVRVHNARADYGMPLGGQTQMQFGGSYIAASINADFINDNYDPIQQVFILDESNSYDMFYQENIGALYAKLNKQMHPFAFEIGIRAEHTDFDLQSVRENNTIRSTRNQWHLFPTAMLKYYINDNQSLSLNVGRRIDRPRFYTLNPYQFSPNPNVEMRGNPDLQPSLDYKVDLSYALNWKDRYSLLVSGGYSYTFDSYNYITVEQEELGNYLSTPENINHTTFTYFSVNSNNEITDWWSLSANVFINRLTMDASNFDIASPDPVMSYSATVTNNFSFWNNASVQIHGGYKSPQTSLYGWANGYQTVDLSFSKAFLSNKLRMNVYLTDIFNINENRGVWDTGSIASDGRWKYETRVAYLQMSYTFGKRVKSKAKRHRAKEDSRYED